MPLNRNHVFDSNGPDLRIRGTAQQLFEKYLQLGRDATSSGDRVMAESYFQHAEHYFRILNAMTQAVQQAQHAQQQNGHQQRRHQPNESNGSDGPGLEANGYGGDPDESESNPPGIGDQPGGDRREIPIATVPPEN